MNKPLPKIEPCPRCKKRGVFEHDANKRLSFRCDCVYGPWKKTERAAIIAWNWMQRSKRRSTKKEVRRVIANASGRHADKAQPMSVERMRITKADRDKLRELHQKATPGEWVVYREIDGRICVKEFGRSDWVCGMQISNVAEWQSNAAAISAAHNALPDMLDALDAAEKRADEAEDKLLGMADAPRIAATSILYHALKAIRELGFRVNPTTDAANSLQAEKAPAYLVGPLPTEPEARP